MPQAPLSLFLFLSPSPSLHPSLFLAHTHLLYMCDSSVIHHWRFVWLCLLRIYHFGSGQPIFRFGLCVSFADDLLSWIMSPNSPSESKWLCWMEMNNMHFLHFHHVWFIRCNDNHFLLLRQSNHLVPLLLFCFFLLLVCLHAFPLPLFLPVSIIFLILISLTLSLLSLPRVLKCVPLFLCQV